jgi:hypothetical protein
MEELVFLECLSNSRKFRLLASRVLQTGHQIYCYFPWLQTVLFASYNLQDTMLRATPKITTMFKVTSAKEKKYQTKLMWANDELRRETLEEAKHAAAEAKEQSKTALFHQNRLKVPYFYLHNFFSLC